MLLLFSMSYRCSLKKIGISNITNVTLACDVVWQLEAHKSKRQVYNAMKTKSYKKSNMSICYKTTKQNVQFIQCY